jgi:hypothetical protein
MNYLSRVFTLVFLAASVMLTGCLDITEEVTYRNTGAGTYTMKMDMSQMKSMMEMLKGMGDTEKGEEIAADQDSTESDDGIKVIESPSKAAESESPMGAGGMPGAADLSKMGEEFTKSVGSLKRVKGITNGVAINDTTSLIYGYSFDFESVDALNRAINVLNKDKFDGAAGVTFVAGKNSFERTKANDLGGLISQAMSESEEAAESMDMLKMFFGDMKYTQIYHFDKKVKKSANTGASISADGKTVTLIAKPFSDDEKTKAISNTLKLK